MRIVAGKYRHRNIIWPDEINYIRPTKDRVREAIFSALGDINDYIVLDLYAGSGAMGIEALSRGAKYCYFVDINKVAIKTINANITNLAISEASVIAKDAFLALDEFVQNKVRFDLLILDPPYETGEYEKAISILINNNLLNKNATLVVERNRTLNYDSFAFKSIKEYHYGDISVDIIKL